MNRNHQPRARREGIATQLVGKEMLIYDEGRHLAFCLNPTSAAVWARCDGVHSVSQITADLRAELAQPVSEDIVLLALAQLHKDSLLETEADSFPEVDLVSLGEISRRNLLTKLGYGAAILLPAIAMIMAPKPAAGSADGGVYG